MSLAQGNTAWSWMVGRVLKNSENLKSIGMPKIEIEVFENEKSKSKVQRTKDKGQRTYKSSCCWGTHWIGQIVSCIGWQTGSSIVWKWLQNDKIERSQVMSRE